MNIKTEKRLEALWYLAIFAFFYIWFSKIHPLIVYDLDDWTYLAYVRKATPIWGDWNPAKVFPEVVMPLVSTIILHTIVPLVGDYITGFTVGHALVVSGFITAYAWCLGGLIKRSFSLGRLNTAMVTFLFLLLHFLVFRTEDWKNTYLFFCEDLNCYYNYLIPALLNACIVMYMMNNPTMDRFLESSSYPLKGIFYVVIYLAIFSNLVDSGILAAYAGSCLLFNLLNHIKKFNFSRYIQKNKVSLVILIMWFVSAIFELSGGRASVTSSTGLLTRTKYSLLHLLRVLRGCNPLFWVTVAVIILLCAVCLLRSRCKDKDSKILIFTVTLILIAGAAITVYSNILCGMVNYNCIYRSEYLFAMFFYGFMIIMPALAYVIKKQPQITVILPLILLFLVAEINTNTQTFEDSLMSDYGASVCADISRDIIEQFLSADEAGLDEAIIYVPVHVSDPINDDNWPHSMVLVSRIGHTLYEQGILSRSIEFTYVADASVNERHHIPIPTAN